ncbi:MULTISPECIES: PAS domain-containing sensor histidine kinase [Roseateles]|uniref:histidine kinase n=1 Tax=Pelomonas aquatica TaxID=431058 RepID=A0ABU1Z247_9BURK|nr:MULTISPECIES: HAMP domain-containing sensor histidine kinase [Roseateles]KQY80991.1 histidine kinase [Pelomonas sp. Root1444]MDR7294694.1 signal transduction histidine kinase [Pelomonas aquatica]
MGSRRGLRAVVHAIGLVACGVAAGTAVHQGYWGLLAGAVLVAVRLGALNWWQAARPHSTPEPVAAASDAVTSRLLLDAAPTPMLAIDGGSARALNRAARRLFATDDRILPVPPELSDRGARHLRHHARGWRIDRVMLGDGMVVALIDIEQEERAAEARASAELIQVLGHELLNGLAPIASLAESGLAAVGQASVDRTLLRDILATLARRAEGLQRFAEAYRTLARLPDPLLLPAAVRPMLNDLARLFASRWPDVGLTVEAADDVRWPMDRDQVSQALWALLQNAAEAVLGRNDGHVTLTARMADAGLTMEISDNGPGIPPEAAARIFRPFHTTKPEGTGIGLSLARQIAQAHGGTLTLGSGAALTTFRLVLPGTDSGHTQPAG